MHGGVCMVGGMDGKWVCMAGGVWHGDMHGRGHAWQESRLLQRAVRILLECILVCNVFSKRINLNSLE